MAAGTITQTQTVSESATDWNTTLNFQQFDPSLGSLQAVGLSLIGDIGGTVAIENLQPDAVSSSVTILGMTTADTPDDALWAVAQPTAASGLENLGPFDGTIDYAGSSGTVVSGLTQTATSSTLQTVSADPGPFIGTGTVPVTVSGQASVAEDGPANLEIRANASAGAAVSLQYQYGSNTSGGSGGTSGSVTTIAYSPQFASAPAEAVASAPQTFIVPDTITDWAGTIAAAQFNPLLGTLEAVSVSITGDLNSSIELENLGSLSSSWNIDQVGSVVLALPGTTEVVTPALDIGSNIAGFDGTIDFQGSSGVLANYVTSAPLVDTLSNTTDLTSFTGSGMLDLSVSSTGTADVDVPGNSLLNLGGLTGATIALSYVYVPADTALSGDSVLFDDFAPNDLPVIGTPTAQTVSADPACFARGTHIATEDGEAPIETLRVGDRVRLTEGGSAPITWIGQRRVDCRRHPNPHHVWPVRIWTHAFGSFLPARDLLLSPDHAIYADGVLIPVKHLLNGSSVAQEPCDTVEYWHLELPHHAAILAESLPTESLLDTGGKSAFDNGGRVLQLHPDFAIRVWEAEGFAPLIVTGPQVDAVRRRIAHYAASSRLSRTFTYASAACSSQ